MTKEQVKTRAKEVFKAGANEAEESYHEILDWIEGNHNERTSRSRVFVSGLIVGILLISGLWILL